jgi:hypothetical protein
VASRTVRRVELAGGLGASDRQELPCEGDGDDPNRDVDEEDPAPAEVVDEQTPVTGPNTGGAPSDADDAENASHPMGAARARMIIPVGISIPPPRPWMMRNAISELVDHASHRAGPR